MFLRRRWKYKKSTLQRQQKTYRGRLKRSARAVRAQCARSATIWASGRSRNPYFVKLWASLLFGSRF